LDSFCNFQIIYIHYHRPENLNIKDAHMLFLTTLLISIIITIAIMPYSLELAVKLQAMDKPDHRKIHDHVMPKCGGMAMVVGAFVPIMLWAPKTHFVKGLLIGGLIIVVFGVADDIKDLSPNIKLLGQIMAALVVALVGGIKISDLGSFWFAGTLLSDWVAIPLTVFVIVGVTNATNLSDGLDGLAGGLALLIFLAIGYLGVAEKDWVLVMIAIAAGGSILGFLRFNSYPAQLFMGDAGSQLLGFVAIVLSIKLAQQAQGISVILPLIILGVPILDTLTVMTRRLVAHRSPFSADRNHFHHQLITVGFYHTEAVLVIYLTQSLLIVYAIACHGCNDWILLAVYLCFAGAVLGAFHISQKTGYKINREGFFNKTKARFKPFKDRGQIIKYAFGIVKMGVPALLIFNALIPASDGNYFFILSGGFLLLLLLAWFLNTNLLNRIAKIALYLFTPFMVFNCDQGLYSHLDPVFIFIYNSLYFLLLASVILTKKLTRRSDGFKSSTLDFLVVFIIILIPNLPGTALKSYLLGLVAVKTVILYYSYEVLVGELRRKSIKLSISAAIFLLSVKSVITII
jgi:UDP-GlcNAc:undecaprenyl-phosphate GlcNAc-1-phosphate transferase